MQESGSSEARAALQRAVACLTQGAFDGRTVDGAQANALEAIAWALVGILQAQAPPAGAGRIPPFDARAPEPVPAREARPEARIVETLERAGFVAIRQAHADGRLPPS